MFRPNLVLALSLLCGACGSSGNGSDSATGTPTFDQAALTEVHGDSNALAVAVRTWPAQPPELGNTSIQLTVTAASSGEPAAGLSLDVLPWMPAMGHGTSKVPVVTETAPGVYQLDNVYMYMPGTWQLRTTFSGAVDDHVVPSFQVQ